MSSILDALKKLEEDKKHLDDVQDIDPDQAAEQLVGSRSLHGQRVLRISPQLVVGGLVVFAIVIVGLSVAVSTMIVRPNGAAASGDNPPQQIATAIPEPVLSSGASEREQKIDIASTPRVESVAEERLVTKRAEPREQAVPAVEQKETGNVPTETRPNLPPVTESPRTSVPVATPDAALSSRPPSAVSKTTLAAPQSIPSREEVRRRLASARETMRAADSGTSSIGIAAPVVATPPPSRKPSTVDPETLPELSPALRARHGLEDLLVNIVSPASATKPKASAIISNMKVFVGEQIHTMRARLIQVESNGIVIEITGSGERYFVKQ